MNSKVLHAIIQFIFFSLARFGMAQDAVESRIIFIGDAGEINRQQETLIPQAAGLILPNKTTVIYLGDNIYPDGMALPGTANEEPSKAILRSQFEPMRAKQAPVYFVPGNHDWDRMGKQGLQKIRAQGAFLKEQQDTLLKLVPENGCPDPVEIPISDQLVVLAYDSEWWLFPYKKSSGDIECACENSQDVLERMEELLYKNRDKTILLASHHPFRSYGVHGGYYSWKDHLFPLTALNSHLFLPLPVVGSLYPLLRSTVFLNPEDLHHPTYQQFAQDVEQLVDDVPNILYVAGHEHGLQLIKDGDKMQLVSGGGAKASFLKKSKKTLFKAPTQGFITVDQLHDKSLNITYYVYKNNQIEAAFHYQKKYDQTEKWIDSLPSNWASQDSIVTQANTKYNQVGRTHRKLFGENYRKEWAADTKVPLLKLSQIRGGMTPLQRGGGMQTVSLRLQDKSGKEWVLRSVNKNTESLLPKELQQTFARDFLDDANSAQHPYSALMVPPLADAVHVAHANPIIGIVAPDSALGVYNRIFANTLCLLEEREPLGDSDNSPKMLKKINNDNDDTYKAKTFLRARLLDLLIGDWDRHEDQWRWVDEKQGKNKDYLPIPRDRDQALRLTDGIFPYLASRTWVLPTLQGFGPQIKNVRYSLFKSRFLHAQPENQFSYATWMEVTNDFTEKITDSVLEESLKRLPESAYALRHDSLFSFLKQRRNAIPKAMDEYYRFINRIVDIKASNKKEYVVITDAPNKGLKVVMRKINKEGEVKGKLMDKTYDPEITKEIRLYLASGNDSVMVNTKNSDIKLRIIGGQGHKDYTIQASKRKIKLYDRESGSTISGDSNRISQRRSKDSTNVAFVPVNLYNVWMPLVTVGYNADDGIMFGGGFNYTHQRGFRKAPFANRQHFLISGALATGAVKIKYNGQWKDILDKADLLVGLQINAPNNTQNFFGLGNNTVYDKENYEIRYYRSRFNLYDLHSALQWTFDRNTTFSVGPAFQLYYFDSDDNEGRFIQQSAQLHTYDSLTIAKDKIFAGFQAKFIKDTRNNQLFASKGGYLQLDVKGLTGLNAYAEDFLQVKGEMAFYTNMNKGGIIFADRIGGGATWGKAAFYQSLFLGGQNNLWGFRQYRFAGERLFFNNFEMRIRLAQIGSYIVPGQLGLIGFYDMGKVWAEGYNSDQLHQGVGGGIYYAPAQIALLQFVAGHSNEGWYPYFTMGFRF